MNKTIIFFIFSLLIVQVFAQEEQPKKVIGIQVNQLAELQPQLNQTYILMTNPDSEEFTNWLYTVPADEKWANRSYDYALWSNYGWSYQIPSVGDKIEISYLGTDNKEILWWNSYKWEPYSAPLQIGDRYLGGTIMYFFQEGDANYGKYKGIVLYDKYFDNVVWGCSGTSIIPAASMTERSKKGNALVNHASIMSSCQKSAASFCASLTVDGEGGWVLPTTQELFAILNNCFQLHRPVYEGKYWTCIDANANDAQVIHCQLMGDQSLKPMVTTLRKSFPASVYPIKYF